MDLFGGLGLIKTNWFIREHLIGHKNAFFYSHEGAQVTRKKISAGRGPFGCTGGAVNDNGKQMKAKAMQQMFVALGIEQTFARPVRRMTIRI